MRIKNGMHSDRRNSSTY